MFLPGSNTGRVSATTKEKDLTRMEKKNQRPDYCYKNHDGH